MKTNAIFSIISQFCDKFHSPSHKVKTVPNVNLESYMGRWYEISSYPQWFEKNMTNVSALYTLRENHVEVLNSGYKNGILKKAHGRAKAVKGFGNARLKVSFQRPFYGKYWIIDLAPDYSWAVISNPKRSTLWILSRNKTMDDTLYRSILNNLAADHFDITKLVKMNQQQIES